MGQTIQRTFWGYIPPKVVYPYKKPTYMQLRLLTFEDLKRRNYDEIYKRKTLEKKKKILNRDMIYLQRWYDEQKANTVKKLKELTAKKNKTGGDKAEITRLRTRYNKLDVQWRKRQREAARKKKKWDKQIDQLWENQDIIYEEMTRRRPM